MCCAKIEPSTNPPTYQEHTMMINRAVYESLMQVYEGCQTTHQDGSVWAMVYIPNISVKGASKHQIAGAQGHYKSMDDKYFGQVRIK
jgi:hypothetical protein